MQKQYYMNLAWRDILVNEAVQKGMCKENLFALKHCEDKISAMMLYKKTINWALEREYPPLDFLRKEFSIFDIEGLFIDRNFDGDILNDNQCYVLHHCTGTIKVGLNLSKQIIPMIYLANDCNITITGFGDAAPSVKIPVFIFGNNTVNILEDKSVDFLFYNFNIK